MTSRRSNQNSNPELSKPAYTPIAANSSVLLAGLMGLRPNSNPALSANFNTGGASGALARRPFLAGRALIGGQ